MKTSNKSYYVTTPVFNAANPPRIGQVYSSVSADTIARYRKMCKERVFFLTGAVSGFHGQEPDGKGEPDYVEVFQETWAALNLEYDKLITHRDEEHADAAAKFLSLLREKGFLYQAKFDEEKHHLSAEDPVDRNSESLHFFKLSELQEQLEGFYDDNPTFVIPQVSKTRIIGMSRQKLKDVWICQGEIGEDASSSSLRLSRWFGALIGYLSGIGYGSDENRFSESWPAAVQLVGEYAITSQALYWPSILMAAGIEPPRHILVNRKLTLQVDDEDSQPSLLAVLGALPDDVLRYVLMRYVDLENDSILSLEEVVEHANTDLSKGIAGQVARVSKMIDNFFDGRIPEPSISSAADKELIRYCQETGKLYRKHLDGLQISKALDSVWELISVVNRYLVATEPWKMVRDATKKEALGNILYNIAESMRIICLLLYPILPLSSARMLKQLGAPVKQGEITIEGLNWGGLKPGASIVSGEPVFPPLNLKKVVKVIRSGLEPVGEAGQEEFYEPLADEASINDFARIDMRVARIIEAERVPKSDKLIKMQVDLGFEKRQVVAGIGLVYDPSELAGKIVAVVANLKPAKLMGEVSQGMIVAASDQGKPSLVVFDKETRIGSRLA